MAWIYTVAVESHRLLSKHSFQIIEPSAMLRTTLMPKNKYCVASEMEASVTLQSGITSALSTEDIGVIKFISSLQDSHANLSLSLARTKEQQTKETCGLRLKDSLAKYDPITSCWKTSPDYLPPKNSLSKLLKRYGKMIYLTREIKTRSQGSSYVALRPLSDIVPSGEFLQTFPKSGMIVNGILFQRQQLVQTISGNESGFWRTPDTNQGGTYSEKVMNHVAENNMKRPSGTHHGLRLQYQVRHQKLFPTILTNEGRLGYQSRKSEKKGSQQSLTTIVKDQQRLCPTPSVHGNNNRKGISKNAGDGLATYAKNFSTPTQSMYKGSGKTGSIRNRLDYDVELPDDHRLDGQLNPVWVEALMGWPNGWTSSEPIDKEMLELWRIMFLSGAFRQRWQDGSWEHGIDRLTDILEGRVVKLQILGNGWCPQTLALILNVELINVEN